MEKRQRAIKILPRFVTSVNFFQNYIFKSSPKNAMEFGDDLLLELEIIAKFANIYKEFPYLKTRKKYYRYKIYKKHFFIVFKLTDAEIIFIEVADARMSKGMYKNLKTE